MRPASLLAGSLALAVLSLPACGDAKRDLAGSGFQDSGGFQIDGAPPDDEVAPIDLDAGPPYAVLGVSPSHGPFRGGTRVELRGRGFSSKTEVRFGSFEVAAPDVLASGPAYVQALTPPGEPGSVDVYVRDMVTGATSVLPSGFTYDAFYADPEKGATAGGTLVTLHGRGTSWGAGTAVTIDGKPCGDLVVVEPTKLTCVAPAGTPGSKAISVTTADAVVSTVRDAYLYADTDDGFRGGLAGEALPGELRVAALTSGGGELVEGATVVVAGSDGRIVEALTPKTGVVSFPSPPAAPLTVTVAKRCLQPTTFAGVKVRSVTAYLAPVLSTECIPPDGQPPPTGGRTRELGFVRGELVWPGLVEFQRAPWRGVPAPYRPNQRLAAYVFVAGRDPSARFVLPDPSQATTPESPGITGYEFLATVPPGNLTLYAIAGIEERSDGAEARFEPYAFGVVRGVAVPLGRPVERVLIPMTGTFTHEARFSLLGIPGGGRGPDRLRSSVTVDLGEGIFVFPGGARDRRLPSSDDLAFVGVPPLVGPAATGSYVGAFEAVTGGAGGAPLSAILRFRTRTAGSPVPVGPFVPVPRIASPRADREWDGRTVSIELSEGSADLITIDVNALDGTTGWSVVAPGDARTILLPDFASRAELGLPRGGLLVGASAARLDDFEYDRVRYGQLGRAAWTAFAFDTLPGAW